MSDNPLNFLMSLLAIVIQKSFLHHDFFLMKVSVSSGKDNELFLQFLGDNSHYLVTITVMTLLGEGESE